MKNFFKVFWGKLNYNSSSSAKEVFSDAKQEKEISEFDDDAFIDVINLSFSSIPSF